MAKMPPKASRSFRTIVKAHEEEQRRQRSTSPFFGTGMHPNGAGGLDSDNFVTGVSGYSFKQDGNAEFNDIILRDLPNSMLANPLVPAVAHDDAAGFAVPGSWGTIMSVTVPVPAGYTQALILNLTVNASALNTTGTKGWLYCEPSIPGFPGMGWSVGSPDAAAGENAVTSDTQTRLLTGLSGSFAIHGDVTTNSASSWGATAGNVANLYASIVFLR